jgi:very-short-patch-repair endonuclease
MLTYKGSLKEIAQQLRKNMTDAERHLWWKIKMKQVKGLIFYRQKPIGEYIVDFYCPKAKLVIEIDGSHHLIGDTIEYDRTRDDYMNSLGLKVLRFNNTEVLTNIFGVLEKIEEEIDMKIPLSPPFSKGETEKLT